MFKGGGILGEVHYLIVGFFLLVISVIDVILSKSIESYTLILSVIPFCIYFVYQETKNKERFKIAKMRSAYIALIFSMVVVLVLKLADSLMSSRIDYLFWVYASMVISYFVSLVIVSKNSEKQQA
ncbi:hypothetical protein BJQ93_01034 [Bacillus subtilis]|nr:hypothetical protein [Bacillus subtilis]